MTLCRIVLVGLGAGGVLFLEGKEKSGQMHKDGGHTSNDHARRQARKRKSPRPSPKAGDTKAAP